MSGTIEKTTEKSRRQLRFNNVVDEQPYQSFSDDEDMPLKKVPDENLFRVPLPPKQMSVREPMLTKTNTNTFVNNFSAGICDEDGTRDKYLQKMKKLEARRSKTLLDRQAKKGKEIENSTKKVDISLSEQSFLGSLNQLPTQVHSADLRISDVSSIHPFESSFNLANDRNAFGPVSSTPFREPAPHRIRQQEATPQAAPHKIRQQEATPQAAPPPVVSTVPQTASVATPQDVSILYETYEEKLNRQMKALSIWCNIILKCDLEVAEIDLGKSKKEADQKLQDLLTKPSKFEQASQEVSKKFSYRDFLKKQERALLKEKAMKCYVTTDIPVRIREMISRKVVAIRDDCGVYCNISLMKTLLRVFLSFNPMWLHLGLETIFNETIDIGDGEHYAAVVSKFISSRLFTDPNIMKNKKFAQGTVKMLVTPAGREALHTHFLTYSCQFFFFVEFAKSAALLEHNPRMFNKSSTYRCLEDVFAEFSREILSASSLPLHKALAKVGFKPTFKQGFLDNFDYRVNGFNDLCDGVVLGKLIEIIAHINHVTTKMREPKGDRLRKIGNVKVVFEAAKQSGFDLGALKPETIVACNKESILEMLWRLVGVYVLESRQADLRRLSLDLENRRLSSFGCVSENSTPDELVLHICQQIGDALGIQVLTIDDLKDGRLLAGAWRLYNPTAPDVTFYPGGNLYKQVVAAAESELDVPIGLQGAVQLFAYMYLTRLFDHHRIHSAATRIQKAFRSYRFLKLMKECIAHGRTSSIQHSYQLDQSEIQRTYIIQEQEQECAATLLQLSESFVPKYSESPNYETIIVDENSESKPNIHDNSIDLIEEEVIEEVDSIDYEKYAKRIQAAVRGWLVRRKNIFAMMRDKRIQQNNAVIQVQALCRGWLVRRRNVLAELRKARQLQNASAVKIQSYVRGWLVRRRNVIELLREQFMIEERKRMAAAILIQSCIRGWIIRRMKLITNMKNDKLLKEEARTRAALKIQALVRGWKARQLFATLKAETRRIRLEEEAREAERLRLEEQAREAERLRLEEAAREAERLRLEEEALEAERIRLEEEARVAERIRLEEEAREAERLRLEVEAREVERIRLEEAAREAERLRLEEEAREAERIRLEEEAREAERIRFEEEAREAECIRLEEEAREAERLRLEEEKREAERLKLEEEEREAERLRLEEEAREAERLRLEEETREADRLRLEEEAREAERIRLEEEAREAERIRLEEEAREAERLRLEEEEREAERLKLEEEEREAERLKLEEEEREAERLRLEEEAQEAERLRLEVEAREAERLRLEQERLKLEEETREAERIRLEEEARNAAELEVLRESSAITIQKQFRGWLVRKDNKLAKDTFEQYTVDRKIFEEENKKEQCSVEDMISLRYIYESVRKLKREQKTIARILEDLKQKAREKKLASYRVSADKAALMIQRWYRGARVRKLYRDELRKRFELMQFYHQMVFEQNGEEEQLKFKSARERLTMYSEYLFDERMYAKKVGAYGINRLSSLTPYFLIEFVDKMQGVAVLLDAIENLDRGMSSIEVLEILSETLSRVTQCRDLRVHEPLVQLGEDCVKIMLHIFHAHYKNTNITTNAAKGLVALHARPHFKGYFTKLPFYVKSAQRRFERYPPDSQEAKNLHMLQKLLES